MRIRKNQKNIGRETDHNRYRKAGIWGCYGISTLMVACRNFLITLLTASIGSRALNVVNEGRGEDFFRQLILGLLGIMAFLIFDTVGIFWQSVTVHRIKNELRSTLYEKILKAPYDRLYAMGQKGELLARLNSDVETVSSVLSYGILTPLMSLISGIGGTVTIGAIHWKLCLVIYAVSLLCWAYQFPVIRRQRDTMRQLQENRASALGICGENVQNGLTVRLCGLAEALEEKVLQNLSGFEKLSRKLAFQKTAETLGSGLLQYLQSVGMLFAGFYLYRKGEIRLGDIVILYQMAALIVYMIMSISSGYSGFQSWIVGFGRLREILNLEEERNAAGGRDAAAKDLAFDLNTEYGIWAEGVRCRLGGRIIHDNLGMKTGPRGIYGLTGESGWGKTTFFRLLTGIYPYEAGELQLFGHSCREYTLESLRRQITYMTQENALFRGTIRDNIVWRSSLTDWEILELLERLGLAQWIGSMPEGLDTPVTDGGKEFSGGQRKCLLLARALAEKSQVYLLDEVFAGVDETHRELFWEELKRIAEKALVIIITHDRQLQEEIKTWQSLRSF